jgi:putative oxygen-independent coproporphyrinogen III oxidase
MSFRSLYIHFPFCEAKCHYCDFYSIGREKTKSRDPLLFENALTREANLYSAQLADQLDTLFMGGGTPSMTPPEDMARALQPLQLPKRIHSQTEWTMEANPSSVDRVRLEQYRALGVNRVSMGVQAMRDDLLANLGRVHSRNAALKALETLFSAGFSNVSVDLLCGVPGQSLADIDEAIEALSAFPITHLSCYLLTLAKSHPMYKKLPNEDQQLEHLLHLHDRMTGLGFEHYEISNFAKPGFRAQHNLVYWTGGSYLGLGPSAHSYDSAAKKRWKNVSQLHRYAEQLLTGGKAIEWEEHLTDKQLGLERWMLALRLDDGIPEIWLDTDARRRKVEDLIRRGLMEGHPARNGYLRLTARGFAVSDQIVATLS